MRAAAVAAPAPSPRVLREAANPMRIILEASKIRRKPGEGDPLATALPAAVPAAPRRASLRAAATPSTALPAGIVETVTPLSPVSTAGTGSPVAPPAAAVPVAQPVTPPVQAAVPTSAPASLPAPVQASLPVVAPTAVAPAPPPQPPQAASVAALAAAPLPAVPSGAPVSPSSAAPATEAPGPGARPRIVSMVAPEFPAAVLRRVGSFSEITVQITINHDGSVGNVSVPSAAYRALEPYVVEALQRWRFEAPGEPRSQRLQLVFNN